ncbi:MAG TPA: HAD family phosphatase [Coriobacteriia bacterium]
MDVIFDLGGVLLTWDPPVMLSSVFGDPRERARVLDRLFGDPDWIELDRGTLPVAKAIERAAQRTGISADRLRTLFDVMPSWLVPVPAAIELVRALRAAGNRLFVLSNMQRATLAHIETAYDFLALFDGRVFSCEVGECKPEPAIYRRLLDTFALDPGATVFIDDHQANLDAAAAFGIATIRFETVEGCRAELEALGCL